MKLAWCPNKQRWQKASTMTVELCVGDYVLIDERGKAYLEEAIENGYLGIRYIASENTEQVQATQYRDVPLVKRVGSRAYLWHR